MMDTEKEKVSDPVKRKVTDQGTGPQQLYEDRKITAADEKNSIPADAKKVRHRVSKKINKRLLNSRKVKPNKESITKQTNHEK